MDIAIGVVVGLLFVAAVIWLSERSREQPGSKGTGRDAF